MTSRTARQEPAVQKSPAAPAAAQMPAARAVTSAAAPALSLPTPAKGVRSPRRARQSRGSDQSRLADLKAKLKDDDYMNGAILRIATVLSARLTLQ